MNFSDDELKEIEKQLSNPEGEFGIKIAENMNESNIQMTISSIDFLNLSESDIILEIGHGNCAHLKKIFDKIKNVQYYGLEISKTMKDEAERINKELILRNDVNFDIYNGIKIPFSKDSFHKIFTVNTIYFWKKPAAFLREIHRVLKKDGILVLTFAQKEFMKNLPFVKEKFNLYDNKDLHQLIKKIDLEIIEIANKTERVKSKSGDLVDRKYSVVKIKKL
ncbi:class I SAM-dependent methyltransferase [Aquimarina muelleri]|uniref:Methyltransferase type 11 domain-containing protein n=1 Tax=Aquimarina muelleri TaxID=279356 RepID=A0A918JXM0_9FLAO|nr:class I SAM-dependent methyltransferase [Aquimarina muelleri]MCX2764450.1 class I SAM-dependent methyltransferase [Aquimarina muelleri]GGX32562.1 hypothetical protein GCM10007384_36690 [Aquimarina muelleri]